MSTTRTIQDSLEINGTGSDDISAIEPTRSSIITSMPCEQLAADFGNATIASMHKTTSLTLHMNI